MADLSDEAMELLELAKLAAEGEKWSEAIDQLRKLRNLKLEGVRDKAEIVHFLAVCLTNQAIYNANGAIELLGKGAKDQERLQKIIDAFSGAPAALLRITGAGITSRDCWEASFVKSVLADYPHLSGVLEQCPLCGRKEDRFCLRDAKYAKIRIELRLCLCEKCLDRCLQEFIPGKPPQRAVWWIQHAEQELIEAAQLAPSENKIKEQLQEVRTLMSKLKISSDRSMYEGDNPKRWWQPWK